MCFSYQLSNKNSFRRVAIYFSNKYIKMPSLGLISENCTGKTIVFLGALLLACYLLTLVFFFKDFHSGLLIA